MKAVISNRIFMEANDSLRAEIEKKLTYKVPGKMPMDPPIVVRNLKSIKGGLISIPVGALDLVPEEYDIVDKRMKHIAEFPEPLVSLRDDQLEVYNEVTDNCIINAKPGWGKTFTALFIAKKLGQKTLIVVHNTNLRNQWKKEVEKVFGFVPGIIGSGEFDMSTPIVVGNTQTLYNNTEVIKKAFGTIILDECHHVPANSFSKLLDENCARFKIGLSGTLKRKDGKHVYFTDYFSKEIHKPINDNVMTPKVHLHKSGFKFMDGGKPWANRVNDLEYNLEYQKYIAMLAAMYAKLGHKVLVVSARTELLKNVAELIGETAIAITGEIPINDRPKYENMLFDNKNVLCGTLSIYKEGISINCLSAIILATPVNNDPLLEQLAGRVNRPHPNKLDPVIVDIGLEGKTAQRQGRVRFAFYSSMGWKTKQY